MKDFKAASGGATGDTKTDPGLPQPTNVYEPTDEELEGTYYWG